MKCIVAIVLALTLVFLLSVLIFVILMPNLPETISNDKMCVAHSDDLDPLCGQQIDVLSGFLQQEMDASFQKTSQEVEEHFNSRRISLKYYVENQFWQMKPAARFTGEMIENKIKNDKNRAMVTVKEWKSGRSMFDRGGFKRYGVEMKNGRIIVPVSGTYYIYSFLDLFQQFIQFEGEPEFVNKNGTIRHSMYKYDYHNNRESELVTTLTPQIMSENGRFSTYSSFVSSLVKLKAGEEISIKVSNSHLLRHPYNNFIGLNLI